MNRFRSCFSKPQHLHYKPNGIFEENLFRREFDFLGKGGAFTNGGQHLKEAVRSNFHWCRDYLNCDNYASSKDISLTYQRNFIQKRLFRELRKELRNIANVNVNKGEEGSVSSNKISNKLNPDKQPEAKKRGNKKTHTLSVEPSFSNLLKNVLCELDESMSDFDLLRSDDTQPVDEMNENDDFHLSDNEMHRDPDLDSKLMRKLSIASNNEYVRRMRNFTTKLPCFKFKNSFLDLVANNQVVLVTGSTGSGKSSQLVQYLLDDFILSSKGSLCNIVVIVPRRVCATALAERVADERGEKVGESIGYQIRFHKKLARLERGCINFMTSGMFLNYWKRKEYINSLSHIFIDEIHERSIECDLILALMKTLMQKKPELRIVLLSATTNVNLFCTYMNGASHLEIAGSTFPVEEYYLEDILKETKYVFKKRKNAESDEIFTRRVLPYAINIGEKKCYPKYVTSEMEKPESEEMDRDFIAETIRYIFENEDVGCILIFLPGLQEIIKLEECVRGKPWFSRFEVEVLRMHSSLSQEEQKLIFNRPPENVWKIIISTPILETSVTVDDIKYILDSGRVNVLNYDPALKLSSIDKEWISKTNAVQRMGRAGRVQKGKCFKLYSRAREESFSKFMVPEFLRVNLEETYLKVKAINIGCVESFFDTLIDPPDKNVVKDSVKTLKEIGALDSDGKLSSLGEVLAEMPASPQIGKLLLMGAVFSCIDPISSIAAYLSTKSPFKTTGVENRNLHNAKQQFDEGDKSDHLIFSRIMNKWENACDQQSFSCENMLSNRGMNALSLIKNQFVRALYDLNFLVDLRPDHEGNNINSTNTNVLKAVLCAGLYPNYTCIKNTEFKKHWTLKTSDNNIMLFHGKSYCNRLKNFESPYFVYYRKVMAESAVFVHNATMVDILPMILFGGNVLVSQTQTGCYVSVGRLISVRMPEDIASKLMHVRERVNSIVDIGLRNPDNLTLLHGDIISCVVKLLSSTTSVTVK